MPALKVRIPNDDRSALADDPVLSKAVKARLSDLLADLESAPAMAFPPRSLASETLTLWVSDAQIAQLESLARQHGIDGPGAAAAALLHGAARSAVATAEPSPEQAAVTAHVATTLDRINAGLGQWTRDDQGRYFRQLRDALLRGPVGQVIIAEAATGTGKTRAFEAAVLDWCAAHPGERAAIAAPTYGVLLQAIQSWHRIASIEPVPEWTVIAGQSEFVSAHALARVLDEHPDCAGAEAAHAWMRQGGVAPADDLMGHAWLMRSLDEATGGAWTLHSQVQVDSDISDEDPGLVSYKAQFTNAARARVLFCTHAMLAVESRHRITRASKAYAEETSSSAAEAAWSAWQALDEEDRRRSRSYEVRNELLKALSQGDAGRLPSIGLLIVDEAHLLEQAFATVFASGISVARLMRALRLIREASPAAVRVQDMHRMESAWETLRRVGSATQAERVSATDNTAVAEAVAVVRGVVTEVLSRAPAKAAQRPEIRQLRAIRLALDVVQHAAGEQSGMSVRVSWSPSVQWPSIEVGRYDVSRELDFLWTVIVESCAAAVSATLFDDVSAAGLEGMRRMLSIRSKHIVALDPIRPAWLYDPVTLFVPGQVEHADGLPRFRRPTKRDQLPPDEFQRRAERWRDDVATYIERAHSAAAGGMLVLMTAHAERAEIVERLRDRLDGPLIEQRPDLGLGAARRMFLEASHAGERPCLIGVGSAWTGLDLSADALTALLGVEIQAAEDRVLTDLVIPIAPIGTNRSLTHEWRRERTGMIAEVGATSIMLRQGIGRLVRRAGLPPNRRLHFLDARMHDAAWRPLFAPVVRALTNYQNRKMV